MSYDIVISCIVCIYGNKFFYWVGSILIIVAYGFYAPVAPAIMSVRVSLMNLKNRQKVQK